jgi:hypothetical protein
MHGGAPGSGAPRGNKNALKHGLYTRGAIEERRQLRALIRQSRTLIQDNAPSESDPRRRRRRARPGQTLKNRILLENISASRRKPSCALAVDRAEG